MKAKELIDLIISDVEKVSDNGATKISAKVLLGYLKTMQDYAVQKDKYDEHQHQHNLARFEADSNAAVEMFRSVVEAGKDALRAALIVNGAAVIALLAFLGNLKADNPLVTAVPDINVAMGLFSLGVLFTTISYGARYFAQFFFADDHLKTGNTFNVISVILALMTYGLFFKGILVVYVAFGGEILSWVPIIN